MAENKEVLKDSPEVTALKAELAKANNVAAKALMDKKIAEGITEGLKAAGISNNNRPVAPADVKKSTLKICKATLKTASQIITKDTK